MRRGVALFCKDARTREGGKQETREANPGRMDNVGCVVVCGDTMWCTICNALTVIKSTLWMNTLNNGWKEEECGTSARHEMRVGRCGVGRQIVCQDVER